MSPSPLPANSSASKSDEKIRRLIVNVCFIIYWLLIFEGALRKWILPGMSKIIFFIRDPFVLYVYYLVIRYKLFPRMTPTYAIGIGLSVVFLILGLMQSVILNLNPAVSAIGWRGYFWYLPLAFVIGEHFKGADLARLCRQTLILTIPIALLTYLQFRSSPYSFLNKTMDEDATPFLLGGEIVRTSGLFTFSIGQVLFIGSIVAMVLCLWLLPKASRPISRPMLWAATGAVLVNVYTSGSRSAFFECAISLTAAMFSGILISNRTQQLRCLILPGVITAIGAVLYMTVFNNAYTAMAERVATANANEGSTLARAVGIFTGIFEQIPRSTLVGIGMGLGSNAGVFLAAGARKLQLAENEMPRIIQESGASGILYVGYRMWLFFWLLAGAIIATRRSNNPFPLLLFSFAGVLIMVGQMTLQGTVNGYGWLFAGFCIAANRLGETEPRTLVIKGRPRGAKRSAKRKIA